jgi:hypothetical protein
VLFLAVHFESFDNVSLQKKRRSAHDEVCLDGLAFCHFSHDSLQPILVALRVDGGCQRRGASDDCSNERRKRAEKCWIDLHFGFLEPKVELGDFVPGTPSTPTVKS